MPDATSPIHALHRSLKARSLIGGALCLSLSVWTLWPLPVPDLHSALALSDPPHRPATAKWHLPHLALHANPIDPKAFEAPLWKSPPVEIVAVAEPTPPPPPPPPPPLKLRLIGILSSGMRDANLRAALFDPDASKVHTVAPGDSVLRYRVTEITSEGVQLADTLSSARHTLNMRSADLKPATNIRVIDPSKRNSSTPGAGGSP